MGYYVRELKNKNKFPRWKLQFVSYKKAHTSNSLAQKPRKEWDIPQRRWLVLGFQESMDLEQARSRARQLNCRLHLKRQEERRRKTEEEWENLHLKFTAAIPHIYKEEFEQKFATSRFKDKNRQKRFMTSWRATQKMLVDIQLDPVDWFDNDYLFYDYFHKKKLSFSYLKKILLITNLWGYFLSRRLGQSFMRIPVPRGAEKARLLEAYFAKCGHHSNQSDPILPSSLENLKMKLKEEQYNWLYLSVWLGLRPQEIDQLKNNGFMRLQNSLNGRRVLWVYQTKLISVPPRYRWKLIPIIFKEQRVALKIIRDGNFQRPLAKTIRKYFGRHTTLYGGRKGFTDLMLGKQQDFIHISQWMGHSSIEQTWRIYKSRCITHASV